MFKLKIEEEKHNFNDGAGHLITYLYFLLLPPTRITELAAEESEYFTARMDKLYPVRQRGALPGTKPPKSPFQRQSLNLIPATNNSTSASQPLRQSQPVHMDRQQGLTRSGRDPIRRKKPVPMPRSFIERPIDVPEDFELAAYGVAAPLKPDNKRPQTNPSNWSYHTPQKTRPQSMIEGTSHKDYNRVGCYKAN